jgi:hypothetical protein
MALIAIEPGYQRVIPGTRTLAQKAVATKGSLPLGLKSKYYCTLPPVAKMLNSSLLSL